MAESLGSGVARRADAAAGRCYVAARARTGRHAQRADVPAGLEWVNVASLRMDQQLGRPVLVEFWDFCRGNSLRTLPYVRAWHARYAAAGLRVISVHAGGYPPSQDPAEVRAAVARLGIEHPVVIDADFALWRDYGNEAWPARYLFDQRLRLYSMHYGEGAYDETERRSASCSASPCEPLAPVRPEDAPGALLAAQTARAGGRVVGRLRGGRRVGGARAHGAGGRAGPGDRAQRPRDRRRALRLPPARRARAPHGRRAGAPGRRRRDLPRRAVHARRSID